MAMPKKMDYMTSLELADTLGRDHRNMLTSVRRTMEILRERPNQEAYGPDGIPVDKYFKKVIHEHELTRQKIPYYEISKQGLLEMATVARRVEDRIIIKKLSDKLKEENLT